MIIIGGERPAVGDPSPEYGELLDCLNTLCLRIEKKTQQSNKEITESLTYLNQAVAKFTADTNGPVDAHINSIGIMHGETIETVKLEKVDNFHTGTLIDHVNGAEDKYAVPAGVKYAITQSINGIDLNEFQKNTTLPLSLIHYVDQFKRASVDNSKPLYFKEGPATVIMNGDRVIISPQYLDSLTGPYSLFYSDTVKMLTGLGLNEERQTSTYYQGTGWNMKGAITKDGQIGIFRPLANKGIYDYINNLPGSGNRYVVLSSTFGDISHKGCLISCAWANNQLQLSHYFFGVNDPDNNPALTEIITSSYKANYNTVNMVNVSDALNKTRTINLNDFFTLGAGVKIVPDLIEGEHPTITADWRYQNVEFLMNISIPVTVTVGSETFKKIFTFTEVVRPGKLVISDTGSVTLLKGVSKDIINNVNGLTNSKWLVANDKDNVLNLVQAPGVINTNGLIITAHTKRNSLRVKVGNSSMTGVVPLLENPSLSLPVANSVSHTFVPTRHFSFGDLAERILPLSQDDTKATYLSYCLASDKLGYRYKELTWATGNLAALTGTQYNVVKPTGIIERNIEQTLPKSLMSLTQPTGGVSLSSLCFTTRNDFKSYATVQYSNGVVTLGAAVTLSPVSMIALNLHMAQVMIKAKLSPAYAGKASDYALQGDMGVFVVQVGKAVVYWSDGVSYVEACVVDYSVNNNTMVLGLKTDTIRYVVSTNTTANKGYRKSTSGDDLTSDHSDLLVYKTSNNALRFVLNKPFGELAGDVSFTTSNFTATVVTLSPNVTNPALTYQNKELFDIAQEMYPACLIPKTGVFQSNGDTLLRIGGTETFDPYSVGNNKVIIIPEGFRCVINGIGVVLDETQERQYTTTPAYFYLEQDGANVKLSQYTVQQNPNNNAVMVGYDSDGTGVRYTRSYIVLDKHLISDVRKGNTIPMVLDDNTELGTSKFFRYKDVIRDN